jgi:ADP-ribose pyrophosphatase YjhB (NUDIX family)
MSQKIVARGIFAAAMTVKALAVPVAFGVAALAFDSAGRVLLVRQTYMRGWRLPGGGVGRGEPPARAVIRELKEEVGLVKAAKPEFFGLYARKAGWVTNVIARYGVADVELTFRPNWEVREILFADPKAPPPGTAPAALRRLAEWADGAPRAAHW